MILAGWYCPGAKAEVIWVKSHSVFAARRLRVRAGRRGRAALRRAAKEVSGSAETSAPGCSEFPCPPRRGARVRGEASTMAETPSPTLTNLQGIVKWFDHKKGFGFIVGPDGQDIFVHFSNIEGEGFRVLKDGGRVAYDAAKGEKGWYATRVVRLDTAEVKVRPQGGYSRSPRR